MIFFRKNSFFHQFSFFGIETSFASNFIIFFPVKAEIQGSKKTGRAQSGTEMRTMTATKIVTSTIIRDCDHCVQLPLEEPQSESEEKNDCDCEW